ncbi:hypothetical protein LTR37_008491 [Vermiconidia calcicola]|uniref:Uncharacterized protein n=1 Tax=Vermiconidia calcicola TaxID=1690605 RepID=A0ACC3NC95_9PEZI|nr:hypothetical protein LTR37_008491 [Vermiconidia calcicola]
MIRLQLSQAALASQHDTFVDDFYKTKFMTKEYTKLEKLQLERLTNDIHPLFSEPLAKATPDYGVVEQSARLATQLIVTGPLDHFFRTMIDNPKFHNWTDRDDPSKNGVEYSEAEVDPRVPITEHDYDRVQEYLRKLASTIEYVVDENDGDHHHHGLTDQLGDADVVDPVCPDGYRSLIHISRKMYSELAEAQCHPGDVPLLTILQLEFAETLVHEACHALRNFINGKIDDEPFFGNEIVAEVGSAAEVRLWGGHLSRLYSVPHAYDDSQNVHLYKHNGIWSKLVGAVVLWEYPTHSIADNYPNNFRVDSKCDLWILWDDLMNVNGGGLRPSLNTGYCFRFDPTAGHVPVKRSDEESQYIPKGFHRIKPGDIVRSDVSKRRRPSWDDESNMSVLFREKRPRLWLTEEETDDGIYYRSEWSVSQELSDEAMGSSSGWSESGQASDVEMEV